MIIDVRGSVITVQGFWDCACDDNYIHRSRLDECPICGCLQEEQPDSMLDEILIHFSDKLDEDERAEMVEFLMRKWRK
jgi:hypothetical protein